MKMKTRINSAKKVLVYGLFIAVWTGLSFAINQIGFVENGNVVSAQQPQQQEEIQQVNQTSVAHNAIGHESHQVIIFQDSSDGVKYSGTVNFNLSKPADVISFEEVTEDPTNATNKIWEVGDKKFVPNTLLKNVTTGYVTFNGSGILAHSTLGDIYAGSFTVNETITSNP